MPTWHKGGPVEIDGRTVQPKFQGPALSEGEISKIGVLIKDALLVLNQCDTYLTTVGELRPGTHKLAQVFFKIDEDLTSPQFLMIKRVLNQIKTGLSSLETIKIKDMPEVGPEGARTAGYVKHHSNSIKAHFKKNWTPGKLNGNDVQWGEIHLRRDLLDGVDPTSGSLAPPLVTLIHEAGHKFASLDDFGEKGYVYNNSRHEYRAPGLTVDEAFRNADSHANFLYYNYLDGGHIDFE